MASPHRASAAAAILILAGASPERQRPGRRGRCLGGGHGPARLARRRPQPGRRLSVPLGAAAFVISVGVAPVQPDAGSTFVLQVLGLLLLGAGGFAGGMAYREFHRGDRQRWTHEAVDLAAREKHRAFLAATSDADGADAAGDVAALTATIARQIGVRASPAFPGHPGPAASSCPSAGIGLERLHPQAVNRRPGGAGRLMATIESGKTFCGPRRRALMELFNYLPDDLRVEQPIAVPMPIGEHMGGFILLGNKPGVFTDDDRRLATTLTLRAGAQLASAHAVAALAQGVGALLLDERAGQGGFGQVHAGGARARARPGKEVSTTTPAGSRCSSPRIFASASMARTPRRSTGRWRRCARARRCSATRSQRSSACSAA